MKTALPENAKIAKEAKTCMQECVSEFISFITSEGTYTLILYIVQYVWSKISLDMIKPRRHASKRNGEYWTGKIFYLPWKHLVSNSTLKHWKFLYQNIGRYVAFPPYIEMCFLQIFQSTAMRITYFSLSPAEQRITNLRVANTDQQKVNQVHATMKLAVVWWLPHHWRLYHPRVEAVKTVLDCHGLSTTKKEDFLASTWKDGVGSEPY